MSRAFSESHWRVLVSSVACCVAAFFLIMASSVSAHAVEAVQGCERESDLPLRLLVVPSKNYAPVPESGSSPMQTKSETSAGFLAKTGDQLHEETTAFLTMVALGALAALLLARCRRRSNPV